MKEIGNENINISKRLYYKKVAAILLVALFVFLGYSLFSSITSYNDDSVIDKIIWNDSYKTCGKTVKTVCDDNHKHFTLEGLMNSKGENNEVGNEKMKFKSEEELRTNLARELEDLIVENQNQVSKQEEFYDL
jgi:hypothetical protein